MVEASGQQIRPKLKPTPSNCSGPAKPKQISEEISYHKPDDFHHPRQKTFQIRQAEESVRIYYEIVEKGRACNCKSSDRQVGERIGQHPSKGPKKSGQTHTAVCGEKEERSPAICSIAEPSAPGFEKNVVNGRSQTVCENEEKRRPDNLSGQRERKWTGRIESGTDWRPAFEGLTSQIKERHCFAEDVENIQALAEEG